MDVKGAHRELTDLRPRAARVALEDIDESVRAECDRIALHGNAVSDELGSERRRFDGVNVAVWVQLPPTRSYTSTEPSEKLPTPDIVPRPTKTRPEPTATFRVRSWFWPRKNGRSAPTRSLRACRCALPVRAGRVWCSRPSSPPPRRPRSPIPVRSSWRRSSACRTPRLRRHRARAAVACRTRRQPMVPSLPPDRR